MNRRTIAIAVVGALAVVAAAFLAVRSLRPESRYEPAPADAARETPLEAGVRAAPAAPPSAARVESVSGTVRVRRAGVEQDVVAEAELEVDDILTTGADGRAVVRVDGENTVVLEAGTAVTWGTISDSLSSVQLDRGFLSASTGEAGGRVFRVQALDRTARSNPTSAPSTWPATANAWPWARPAARSTCCRAARRCVSRPGATRRSAAASARRCRASSPATSWPRSSGPASSRRKAAIG